MGARAANHRDSFLSRFLGFFRPGVRLPPSSKCNYSNDMNLIAGPTSCRRRCRHNRNIHTLTHALTHLHTHTHTYTHTHTLTHTHTQQRRIKEASVAASWRRRRRRRRRRCRRLPKIKLATSAENFYGFFFVCELILHWRWLTVQNSIYQLNSLLLLPIYYSASAIHHWLNSVLITANISLTRAQSSQM